MTWLPLEIGGPFLLAWVAYLVYALADEWRRDG